MRQNKVRKRNKEYQNAPDVVTFCINKNPITSCHNYHQFLVYILCLNLVHLIPSIVLVLNNFFRLSFTSNSENTKVHTVHTYSDFRFQIFSFSYNISTHNRAMSKVCSKTAIPCFTLLKQYFTSQKQFHERFSKQEFPVWAIYDSLCS